MNKLLFFALVAGTAVCGWTLIMFALGLHSGHNPYGQYTDYGSVILLIYIFSGALKDYRAQLEKKRKSFTFQAGAVYGMRLSLITAALITVFMFFYNYFINPDRMKTLVAAEKMRLSGLGAGGHSAAQTSWLDLGYILQNPALAATAIFAGSFLLSGLIVLVESRLLIRRYKIGS